MDNIEQIFFEEIIKEAATGYIDCGFFVPICFSTKELVNGQIREITNAKSFDNTMIPSLVIQDRQQLTNDIASYLEVAKNFYQLDPRVNDSNNKSKYIIVSLDKQSVVEETPYGINIRLEDDLGNTIYDFPTIRYGISDNKAYIYAIQGEKHAITNKKIERILSEKYKNQMSVPKFKSFVDRKKEQVELHDTIQRNITDKFIRSFRRLDHHFDNITIESFQLDIDSSLHFKVDGECKCNNTLLSHVYNLSNNYIKESKQFGSKVN